MLVGDGPCRAALEQEIAALGIEGRARLLGNRLDVPRLLPGFDVFSLPSIAEGMSNTVLEAMAAGLPVVATRVGGTPDMVEDGVTGALVAPRDLAGLAAALDTYLADPFLRDDQGVSHYDLKGERGTIMRVAPDLKSRQIVCTGIRFSVGLAFNHLGDLFATDQEGGRVQRMGPPHWPKYPPGAAYLKATNELAQARELTRLGARLMAHDLREVGVTFFFGVSPHADAFRAARDHGDFVTQGKNGVRP